MAKLLVVLGISNADALYLDMARALPKLAPSQTMANTVPTRDVTISLMMVEIEGMCIWSATMKEGEGG